MVVKNYEISYIKSQHTANTPYYGYCWSHITNPDSSDNVDPFVCGSDACCIFGLASSSSYFIAKSFINVTGTLTVLSNE